MFFFQMIVCGKYLISWLGFINFVGVSTLCEKNQVIYQVIVSIEMICYNFLRTQLILLQLK